MVHLNAKKALKFCKKLTPYVDYCRLVLNLLNHLNLDSIYWLEKNILKYIEAIEVTKNHLPTFCSFGSRCFFLWLPPGRISHVYWVRSPHVSHSFSTAPQKCVPCLCHIFSDVSHSNTQWIGWWENLQETMVFTIKYRAFRLKFSHHPILWNTCSVCFPSMSRPPGASPLRLGRHFLRFRYGVGCRTRSLWSQARGGQLGRFGTQAWDLPNVA